MTFEALTERAHRVAYLRELSESAQAGTVGAALETDQGNVYTGVCIDMPCGIGFCAEHAAAAAMVTAGESRVVRMVAVSVEGKIYPPCGRCREFIRHLHPGNVACEVLVGKGKAVRLAELLPHTWEE